MGAPELSPTFQRLTSQNHTLLIPYVMAGVDDSWIDVVYAVIAAGADAVEIGLPFSDPIIDGPTIQEAGVRSLERGTTAQSVLAELKREEFTVPLVVMTYYNVVAHLGHERFAGEAKQAGITGAIVPDLSLEELDGWEAIAEGAGIDPVLLVAPSSSPERTKKICARSRGFVYGVARMGVTGERSSMTDELDAVVTKIRAFPSPPVCVGIGVSTPEQATRVGKIADGVIVGSALVRRVLDGEGPEGAAAFVSSLRQAIDA